MLHTPSPERPRLAAPRCPVLVLAALALTLVSPARSNDAGVVADDLADVLAQPVIAGSRLAAASKYEQDAVEAPSIVYVRTGGEIRAQGYRTLAEVLESLPGVHLRQDRSYTYVGVRGIERPGDYSSRLLLLIDGIRANEAIYDSATAGREFPIDVGLIDRVEFIPGTGSTLYGSNAVLGVVNVVTRTASQLPGAAAALEFASTSRRKLSATWGGDLGPARLLVGIASERSSGYGSLFFSVYDNPTTNNGLAMGRDAERSDRIFAKARWGELNLTTALSERLKADPTGAYGVLFNTRSDSLDRYALADLDYGHRWGDSHEFFARLGVAGYGYRGYGIYGTAQAPVPAQTQSDSRWLSGELRYVWSGWLGHRILLGAEFQDNWRQRLYSADLAPPFQVYTDITTHSSRHSLFVNDEWQISAPLRLNLGLRGDRQLDGRFTATPRVAMLWSATPQWNFKLQRGSAFREPNISETSYQDGSQSTNANLKVESLRSTELTALWRPTSRFDASATWYRLDLSDSINFIDLPGGQQVYANTGNARARGLEIEATLQWSSSLRLRGSWARQRTRDLTTGAALSDSPRSVSKLMATAAGPWPGSTLGLNVVRIGERLTLAAERLDPYVRVNTQLNFAPAGQRWSIGLGLYNLTGARYADPGGPEHLEDSLAQDGRQFRAQFGWSF